MPPVVKKVGDTDESYSWADTVKTDPDQPRYRNGDQYVDPHKCLVPETLEEDTEEIEEMCVSVSSLSLTSSPVSGNGSNMVSPDKTMMSPRTMRTSPSSRMTRSVRCVVG